jgi:hypothetical protein
MPSKKAGETRVRSPKTIRVKVSGEYENANWHEGEGSSRTHRRIKDGDTVQVQKGAPYKHGDIVAYECPRCSSGTYHARFYYRCVPSAKSDFRLTTWRKARGGDRFKDGEVNIIGPVILADATKTKTATEKPSASRVQAFRVVLDYSMRSLSLHKGDCVIYTPNDTPASIGKLIGVHCDGVGSWFARVCLSDERGIYIVDGEDERGWLNTEYDYSAFGPVIEIKRASEVNAEKIAELRERLERVRRNDDDSICDTSRIFELERELYALENPIEDEDGDDWPEVIGEGGDQ